MMNSKLIWRTPSVDVVSKQDLEGVGNIRAVGSKAYRWVLNKDASNALAQGDLAYHKLSDGADMDKYVYRALTANLSVLAGVVVGTDGLAAYVADTSASFGWVQIYGYNASVSVSGATTGGTNIAAGDYLKGVNDKTYGIRDAATQPLYGRNVQILEAVTTAETPAAALKKGFVNCL